MLRCLNSGSLKEREEHTTSSTREQERMMSLEFYFAPMSTASITDAVLAELDVGFERITLDIDAGDTRTPGFLNVNPNGRVPVIVHNGTPIWEACAITMYLGEIFGVDKGLYPASGPKRGEAMKWIAWGSVTLAEAAGRLSASLPVGSEGAVQTGSVDFAPESAKNDVAMDKAKADLSTCLSILDGALEGGAFLLGDYSLADTHLYPIIDWLSMMGFDLSPFGNVTAWKLQCGERHAIGAASA
jgi:glutathione S-transferase